MIGIIGSTNIDVYLKTDHFTEPGETQNSLDYKIFYGGKGANQASTVSKLSKKQTAFLTCIGNDFYGTALQKEFEANDLIGYQILKEEKTGRAFIEVEKTGENRIITAPGANHKMKKDMVDDFLDRFNKDLDIVLIQNELPKEIIDHAITKLKEKNIKIFYDPAPKEKTDLNNLDNIFVLTPNLNEFSYIYEKIINKKFDENNIKEQLSELKEKTKIDNIIITLGKKGSLYINKNNEIKEIDTFKVKPLDTTASGDVFNGTLALEYFETDDLEKSIKKASAAAALSTTKIGAQTSIPTIEEIDDFLKNNG
ncbi:MAG: PfkB family carbohydrate kinase [Thermotogota bacterium]